MKKWFDKKKLMMILMAIQTILIIIIEEYDAKRAEDKNRVLSKMTLKFKMSIEYSENFFQNLVYLDE
jgi:hypothetical protein